VLLVEDLWAAPLASVLDRSVGLLIDGDRIPPGPGRRRSRRTTSKLLTTPPLVSTRADIITYPGGSIVRRRHIARKAVKTAITVKAAQRLGRRAEKHLGRH
jgi:hypothetical protein